MDDSKVRRLALDAGDGDALNKGLLREEKDDQDRARRKWKPP